MEGTFTILPHVVELRDCCHVVFTATTPVEVLLPETRALAVGRTRGAKLALTGSHGRVARVFVWM